MRLKYDREPVKDDPWKVLFPPFIPRKIWFYSVGSCRSMNWVFNLFFRCDFSTFFCELCITKIQRLSKDSWEGSLVSFSLIYAFFRSIWYIHVRPASRWIAKYFAKLVAGIVLDQCREHAADYVTCEDFCLLRLIFHLSDHFFILLKRLLQDKTAVLSANISISVYLVVGTSWCKKYTKLNQVHFLVILKLLFDTHLNWHLQRIQWCRF